MLCHQSKLSSAQQNCYAHRWQLYRGTSSSTGRCHIGQTSASSSSKVIQTCVASAFNWWHSHPYGGQDCNTFTIPTDCRYAAHSTQQHCKNFTICKTLVLLVRHDKRYYIKCGAMWGLSTHQTVRMSWEAPAITGKFPHGNGLLHIMPKAMAMQRL